MCIILAMFLTGCTNGKEDNENTEGAQVGTPLIIEHTNIGASDETSKSISSLLSEDYLVLQMASYNDLAIIVLGANGNLEIAPSKILIADIMNDEILYETDSTKFYYSPQIITLEEGFYIQQGIYITVYDYKLSLLEEIDLPKLQQEEAMTFSDTAFSLSQDMRKATYVNFAKEAVVIYDFETEEEKEILQLSKNIGGISFMEQLCLTDEYIGFSGGYIYSNDYEIAGSNVHGRINIETGEVDQYVKNETTIELYGENMLVVDLLRYEDSDLGTGEAIIYNIQTNEETLVNVEASYNSFDMDIVAEDFLVSYNDVGRNKAKLILYRNGESMIIEDGIPSDVLNVGSCYDSENKILHVFYTIPYGETDIKSELRSVRIE